MVIGCIVIKGEMTLDRMAKASFPKEERDLH